MEIVKHHVADSIIAEIRSDMMVISNAQDGLDLLGNVYYQGYDKVIIYAAQITPEFFDLRSGMAGELLQKFSNYRVQLAIAGDFSVYKSQSLRDFIFESNARGQIVFVEHVNEALALLTSKTT
jgi:hypothetical protein